MEEDEILKEAVEIDHEDDHGLIKKKSPLWWIIGIFLALSIVVMAIPYYSVRLDPSPKKIPSVEEVVPKDIIVNETHFSSINMGMIKPNDPVIKEVADKIVSAGCDSDKVCQAKAIFYFVRDNFVYISDPLAYEYVKTARESLVSGGGDCDDSSVLLANLFEAIGIRTRFVFIPRHVYVELYMPTALNRYKSEKDWVPVDGACRSCEFGEISWQSSGKEKHYLG